MKHLWLSGIGWDSRGTMPRRSPRSATTDPGDEFRRVGARAVASQAGRPPGRVSGVLQGAIAHDGPLAGSPTLTVEVVDGEWPETEIWTGPDGERHEYRLGTGLADDSLVRMYTYVRTLPAEE
jgi:hypothetical protein